MAEQMRTGKWKLTGQAHVIIGSDGVLLNGQHTLSAIVEAGIPVRTVVSRGIDPSAFDAIDTGLKRTAAQVVAMMGRPNASTMAGGLRLDLLINSMRRAPSGWTIPINKTGIANEDVVAHLELDPTGWEMAALTSSHAAGVARRYGLLIAPSPIATWYHRALEAGAASDDLDQFVADVISDEGHFDGYPATTLRRRLTGQLKGKNTDVGRVDAYASWCKAWNAMVRGDRLDQIRTWGRKSRALPTPIALASQPDVIDADYEAPAAVEVA